MNNIDNAITRLAHKICSGGQSIGKNEYEPITQRFMIHDRESRGIYNVVLRAEKSSRSPQKSFEVDVTKTKCEVKSTAENEIMRILEGKFSEELDEIKKMEFAEKIQTIIRRLAAYKRNMPKGVPVDTIEDTFMSEKQKVKLKFNIMSAEADVINITDLLEMEEKEYKMRVDELGKKYNSQVVDSSNVMYEKLNDSKLVINDRVDYELYMIGEMDNCQQLIPLIDLGMKNPINKTHCGYYLNLVKEDTLKLVLRKKSFGDNPWFQIEIPIKKQSRRGSIWAESDFAITAYENLVFNVRIGDEVTKINAYKENLKPFLEADTMARM